ncbi:hypothetical protein [Sphingopyxis sp.]|uniref:hypothetical protein n=1 Tax=Sphingopyxis sp. TaxID=1908224 RepID=UPI002D79CCDA|nr:hypothetical protein [Sphingopyxis sp.]HET6522909.1 hypothetical protein [Sphingopyxis sp.]
MHRDRRPCPHLRAAEAPTPDAVLHSRGLTVNGRFAPGNSIGTLNVAGNLALVVLDASLRYTGTAVQLHIVRNLDAKDHVESRLRSPLSARKFRPSVRQSWPRRNPHFSFIH